MTAPTYEVMAQAFAAEGVDIHFTLMGNANMYWADAMARRFGVRNIHARHEHCAVGMACGYARSTGKVGVASVTDGPGFTQIATELTVAARSHLPLVVLAGDTPLKASYAGHAFDQRALTLSTGAEFMAVRSVDRMLSNVRDAFYVARYEQRPVVLSVPEDLQAQPFPYLPEYTPSSEMMPSPQRPTPDPDMVGRAIELIRAARRPVIIGGRGAVTSGAGPEIEALAGATGALLATSLLAKGMFDGHPFNIGIAGAFSHKLARELFAEADLVIGVGSSLGYHTTEGGYLYPNAQVIQVDAKPRGLWQGGKVADLHVQADAKRGIGALVEVLEKAGHCAAGWHTGVLQERLAAEIPDPREYHPVPGTLDPRQIMLELNQAIPEDWDIVCGTGHFFHFVLTHLNNRPPERYHPITAFSAIGSAIGAAIGIAAARGDGKVVLFEGDGSMMMHIQELETMQRHGIKMLTCVMNDGGYGAEAHKFRAKGKDASQTIHGRPDFARLSRAFGLDGEKVGEPGRVRSLLDAYQRGAGATVWDLHVDDMIPSAMFRRLHYGEA